MRARNPVMEVIYTAFQLEIDNDFVFNQNCLTVNLPNQKQIMISAPQISTTDRPFSQPLISPNKHTYHYQYHLKHSDTTQPNPRLFLHNLEECRVYLDDICNTFLTARVHDFEITFPDGTVYLLMVSEK